MCIYGSSPMFLQSLLGTHFLDFHGIQFHATKRALQKPRAPEINANPMELNGRCYGNHEKHFYTSEKNNTFVYVGPKQQH